MKLKNRGIKKTGVQEELKVKNGELKIEKYELNKFEKQVQIVFLKLIQTKNTLILIASAEKTHTYAWREQC